MIMLNLAEKKNIKSVKGRRKGKRSEFGEFNLENSV